MISESARAEAADDDANESILRRSPRIKEDDVHRIADELLLEGHRPSVDRIRSKLGRGSPNTIALFLDRWWSKLGARLRDLPGTELPPVPSDVSHAMHALWTLSIDHARTLLHDTMQAQSDALSAQRQEIERRGAELSHRELELSHERNALLQSVQIAHSQLEEANERNRQDLARINDLEADRARLTRSIEQERAERKDLNDRLERVQKEHHHEIRVSRERSEALEQRWQKELNRVREELTNERNGAQSMERQLAQERQAHTGEIRSLNQDLQVLKIELGQTQERVLLTREQLARTERQLLEQTERADRVARMLEEVQSASSRQIELLQQQLKSTTSQLEIANAKLLQTGKRSRSNIDKN